MAGQQHPPGGYSQSNAYYGAPQNAQYNNDPPRQYYDAKGPNNQYGSGPPYEPKAQYPATTNINVIPPTGQQYSKYLLSYWLDLCILTTWQCIQSVLWVDMIERQVMECVELSWQSYVFLYLLSRETISWFSFILVVFPIWSYLLLVSSFSYHYLSCLSHPLNLRLDKEVTCKRCREIL